ncbi:MAG TPA: S8 family peptidase [Hanamia sp.]|jgi:subtilisin family serine protease|nr:S8 family peptidase [Hanamia sp.]
MTKRIKRFFIGMALLASLPFYSFAQADSASAEAKKIAPNNWHELDRATSGFYGISLDKAYDFLKGRKSKTVVVAVIDSGVDTLQEDLKPILWHNPGEIPGNGIDDDHNGYVDDVYGWNFIGGKDGKNVHQDSYEAARVYWKLKDKYDNKTVDTTTMNASQKREYAMFLRAKDDVTKGIDPAELLQMQRILPVLEKGDSVIQKDLGKTEFTGKNVQGYTSQDPDAKIAAAIYLNMAKANKNYDISNTDILDYLRGQIRKGEAATTPPENFRDEIVKDNPNDINDRYYGNNDVMAGTPSHGTHCSGIIAAVRNNGLGMDGIADNVRIMMVRAVPDGDEHDKDIANAIRYAVDNGAEVISMSFGKSFSPQKSWVDDAVKYAQSKGVLLVHAAGNDAKNIDSTENFPNPVFLDGSGVAKNFVTVGASGDSTNGGFAASFSNYGKESVDVFAPGVNIYSTLPGGNKYGAMSGTSMATPVVAGVAALILEYFPDLSADQVKYVIDKSAQPITEKVKLPGTTDSVNLSDISVTGGEVNAYNAVKLASTLKGERSKNANGPEKMEKEKKRKKRRA